MAMWVFDRSGQRAAAQIAAGRQLGEGVRDAAFIIADSMNRYAERKAREDERQLALIGVLASKYSFNKLGPDVTRRFEELSGVKFQRDSSGKPIVPETDQEAFTAKFLPDIMRQAEANPERAQEIAMGLAGWTSKAKPQSELDLESRRIAVAERKNQLSEKWDALRYGAQYYRAQAAAIKASRSGGGSKQAALDQPSEWVVDPQNVTGPPLHYTQAPPETPRLSHRDAEHRIKRIAFDKQESAEKKQLFTEAIKEKNEENEQFKMAVTILKDPKARRDPNMAPVAEAIVRRMAKKWDYPIEDKPNWFERFTAGFNTKSIASDVPDTTQGVDLNKAIQGLPATVQEKRVGSGMTPEQIRALFNERKAQGMTEKQFMDEWERTYPGQGLRVLQILMGRD